MMKRAPGPCLKLGWPGQSIFALLLLFASACPAQTTPYVPVDGLPRDPLELRALTEPEGVLKEIPGELARAQGSPRKRALLYLAQANACRVVANWQCQRDAGTHAAAEAKIAGDPIVRVRGIIASSRAYIALKDYARGTRQLSEAEVLLEAKPLPELSADINLAYSSMSYALGKLARSVEYANRGLEDLGSGRDRAMQGRLLRNRARAEAQLGNTAAAVQSLERARVIVETLGDPKLSGEIALETARLAHLDHNVPLQRTSAAYMLASANRLSNSQLDGLAHEVLGNAALDANDTRTASSEYQRASASFKALRLDRDELRVLRSQALIQTSAASAKSDSDQLLARILDLSQVIERSDRAVAADDLDARVAYVQQEKDLATLQREQAIAEQRAIELARHNQLVFWLAIAAVATLLVFALLYGQLRRVHARLRSAFQALNESESRASSLLNLSKGCIFLHDEAGKIIAINPAAAGTLGMDPQQMVGRLLQSFLPATHTQGIVRYLEQVTSRGEFEGTLILLDDDRQQHHWRATSTYVTPPDTQAFVVVNAVDVTEQIQKIEDLSVQNLHDELTGCYNRRQLGPFEEKHSNGLNWAVVAIDLDGFKTVNDRLGHEEGDRILVQVARYLREHCRSTDIVVRLGGDEFVILLTGTEPENVEDLVDRLKRDMPTLACRFTMGSAIRDGDESLAATLARADMTMIDAKQPTSRSVAGQ